jgi:hypothetical protein
MLKWIVERFIKSTYISNININTFSDSVCDADSEKNISKSRKSEQNESFTCFLTKPTPSQYFEIFDPMKVIFAIKRTDP